MRVRIVMAWPDGLKEQQLQLKPGSSLRDLLAHNDLSHALKEAWISAPQIGVFGEPRSLDDRLSDGDRVEIWRSLTADPKEARRARARAKRAELAAKRRSARPV